MDIRNETTIKTFRDAVKFIKGWDPDLFKGRKDKATEKLRKELPLIAKAVPAIKQSEIDLVMTSNFADQGKVNNAIVSLETVYRDRELKSQDTLHHIKLLSEELAGEQPWGFLSGYQLLAGELQVWADLIEKELDETEENNTIPFEYQTPPVSKKQLTYAWGGEMTVKKLTSLMVSDRLRYKKFNRQSFVFDKRQLTTEAVKKLE